MTFATLSRADATLDRLADFLARLELMPADMVEDSVITEIIETGGDWMPNAGGFRGVFEVNLHGVVAQGANSRAAIRSWRRQALSALSERVEPAYPPCGTPRNAAEEIANARAALGDR